MYGALFALALGSISCTTADDPNVTYGEGKPVNAGQAGRAETDSASGSGGSASSAADGGVSQGMAGRVSAKPAGGGSGSGGAVAAGSGAGGTGAVDGGGTGAGEADVTSVSFDVTTLSQGGKYSPKNIGAIWVQNSSGAFIKSLELWAKQRRTHLKKFNAAVGTTGAVDVTASATLSSHRAHHVSWNLKDRSGASVAPGKYSLLIEVTDYDGKGQWYSVDFDTSSGAQSLTPASSPYYSSMTLELQ